MRITCKLMHRFLILCFLFTYTAADHISINCGGGAAAVSGRKWGGDSYATPKGSSKASTVKGELITAVDPLPYSTARISRSQFSYSFHLTPGQKFIRLHFNPVYYHGFESFHDLFSVEAGPFTLLANFSASLTARALSLNILAKEFCIVIQQNQPLNIVFSPETRYNYAFINGIEIISVPSTISYCHGGDSGVHVLGQKTVIYIDNTTALERVYHQNIKWGSVSFVNDIGGMFGVWASLLQENANKASNLSYGVSVDVGFRYLVRVHLYELGSKMNFVLMIDNTVALTSDDILQQSENQSVLWYNYMVMVKGNKREGRHRICISLHSQHEFVDRQGPLEGFEVFKLSNHDLTLATPNLLPPPRDSPQHSTPTLLHSLLGRKNSIATVVFAKIFLVNIVVHLLHKLWGTVDSSKEENEPSARAKQPCRRFSLAEIQSATDNFHSGCIIGKGGFGKVYKGFIDNGREIVAVKRLKPDSNQGEQQFWTEVEMLSELRHVNLVPLLGFCVEKQEMILVYEYMPCGTLADHLFKLSQKSHDYIPLSWKQRLKICIGAGRAIDYLHTGHGIIHRDVKSTNILLDEKFVAKVSDFGLAKTGFGSDSQSQQSTLVKGTRGYLDPNYCETHKPTKNSDTYSFGVVLLEVLCGRRALEQYDEEDKCRLTTWAIDNISKGQVAHIVLPSLIREISPDSLETFVRVAKRCLHDQPKKRPAIAHIVMKLELALQQQEKAESLDPNERTGVENLFSSTDKYQNDNMNFMAPNEKINIVLPQKENATSSAPYEIRNVTDVMPRSDNDRTILSSSLKPTASSSNGKTVSFLPSQQINSTIIKSGKQGGRKSMMLRISQKIWPWDAFWKTRKPSKNKREFFGTSVSAPISHGTSSIPMDDNTERTDGMILTPATVSSNEKEQHSRTMQVMDNISEGQVDRIVAPTLRGEISPDSLRTFVNIAERWLHDEPKNRPRTIHILTKIELAIQQQEMAESSPPKDRTSVEDGSSFTGTSQKANMKIFGPNENKNVANDASPSPAGQVSSSTGTSLKMNMKLSEPNKKIDVADDASPSLARQVSSSTGTSQKANMELFGANKKMNVADDASYSLAGQVLSSTGTCQKADAKLFESNKKINVADDASSSPAGKELSRPNLRVFSFNELKAVTRNFRSDLVLGEGGFGKVYKGCLDDRATAKTTIVAVKLLNYESMQGLQEWQSEVNFLGKLSHPNLVKLLGYCHEDRQLLLVYEFMPKGSLENHLLIRSASIQPLPWDIRLKILIGAARGLAFLHASDRKIIYRDFKTSNILLDEKYHAKLSDFGLAKIGPTDSISHVTTQIMGTYGYAAPEYIATGHLYVKSDVYGFGVVLLEILTGLRAHDHRRPSGQQNLVDWLKPHLSNERKLKQMIDVRLEGRYPSKSAQQLAKVAITCLENEPRNRPSMQEIVKTLERIDSN
ncbi:receptor-like protein kinase FERONIA [Salvia miltiorrhiza]|uniref:receptor-like protein kinase FERONIA n=1 Tax=Salvia miltiorrhiza TaxID=226208 RepID=UPI0025AD3E54|nr:receptor-like protein kinase FERONIA [Salvia miltiorrhiza]